MVSANQESECAGGEQGESLDRLRAMRTGLLFLVPFFGACESARLVCVCMCVWFERLSACVHSHMPFGRLDGGGGLRCHLTSQLSQQFQTHTANKQLQCS